MIDGSPQEASGLDTPSDNQDPGTPGTGHGVRVHRMRNSFRDILACSSAGEELFPALSHIPPVCLVEHFTLAWTGNPDSPVALRREGFFGSDKCPVPPRKTGTWYHFKARSTVHRIAVRESDAWYPDAGRTYSTLPHPPYSTYFLVVGNLAVRIWFDHADELARLPSQRHSILDLVSRSLLDYRQRELRHLQEQLGTGSAPGASAPAEEADRQTLEMLGAHGAALGSTFGIVSLGITLARDLAVVLLPDASAGREWKDESDTLTQTLYMDGFLPPGCPPVPRETLTFPLFWGTANEEGLFSISLGIIHRMNPHVRRELQLNQALYRLKQSMEAFFERRYRDLRIAQDNAHFQRCKAARSGRDTFRGIMDMVVDALPEYGALHRILDRNLVFPRFESFREKLQPLFIDCDADPLEFRDHVRLRGLDNWEYLDIHTPDELLRNLRAALRAIAPLVVTSDHPGLARLGDLASADDTSGRERVLFFNDAATFSVLMPEDMNFHFQRMKKMCNDFLESAGEGMSRLFQSISLQSGIPNRSAMSQTLTFMVNQVQYADMVELEVSALDIVRFKIYNELFGHPFGDRIIRYVGHQLAERAPGSVFHMSGDEFCMIQCHTNRSCDPWVSKFFSSKGIISHDDYSRRLQDAEKFAKGIAVPVVFTQFAPRYAPQPLGSYDLADFIGNFFTENRDGVPALKEYSRTGRDYHRVIHDPERKIQALVDKTWASLQGGEFRLGSQGFRDFVSRHSDLGHFVHVVPRLSMGTVGFNHQNILPYPSDILEAADAMAARNKA